MRSGLRVLAWLVLAAAAPPGRVALGQFGRWGAFRDAAPRRCFAVVRPVSGGQEGAALAIATWPGLRARDQLHLRLGRPASTAVLDVGGRLFALRVRGAEAWGLDARDDARIAAALRVGAPLQVRGTDERSRRFHLRFPPKGAASAIDAMRLGCLPD